MPKQAIVERAAFGIALQYNPTSAPPGALRDAKECVIDREGIVSKRRGFERLATRPNTTNAITWMGEFEDTLLVLSNGSLYSDRNGDGSTWDTYTGSFDVDDEDLEGYNHHAAEAGLSLYFTDRLGIQKLDRIRFGSVVDAGITPASDCRISLTGTGGSWFTPDTQVAYRVCFLRIDDNGREVRSEPSPRAILANPKVAVTWTRTTTTVTVTQTSHGYSNGDEIEVFVTSGTPGLPTGTYTISNVSTDNYDVTVPDAGDASGTATVGKYFDVVVEYVAWGDLTTDDFLEVYRTDLSASASTSPGDDMRLVTRHPLTGDTFPDSDTYTDDRDSSFLDTPLYTNANEQGPTQENSRPPRAADMALYEGYLFLCNCWTRPSTTIRLIDDLLDDGSETITLDDGDVTEVYTGETAEAVGSKEFEVDDESSTLAERVRNTMISFTRIVNEGSTAFYARYVSGEDDSPGKVLITHRLFETNSSSTSDRTLFTVVSNTGSKFDPELPSSGSSYRGTPDESPARLYRTKLEEYDAVPTLNYDVVGSEDDPILRVLALNNALVILKEEEGVWLLTGESEATFSIDQVAKSVRILGPETAVVLDDSVYCYSNQGVVRIRESGEVAIVSRPIEELLEGYVADEDPRPSGYASSFAIGDDRERKYFFCLNKTDVDEYSGDTFVFDVITQAWTRWTRDLVWGYVMREDQKLYQSTEDGYVVRQRSYAASGDPYRDEDETFTVATVTVNTGEGTTTVTGTWTYSEWIPKIGDFFVRSNLQGHLLAVTNTGGSNYTLLVEDENTATAGAATISRSIEQEVEWTQEYVDSPATSKKWLEAHVTLDYVWASSVDHHEAEVTSDIDANAYAIGPYNVEDSRFPPLPFRFRVPRRHATARGLSVRYINRFSSERADVTGLTLVYRGIGEKTMRAPR